MESALCSLPFSPLRASPSHQAEQLSQLLCGEPVRLLENAGDWSLIETEHQYQGFVRSAHLKLVSSEFWQRFLGFADAGSRHENPIFECFQAFQWEEEDYRWQAESGAGSLSVAGQFRSGQSIAELAMRFLGVPYVWGGKTPAGLDCSGLVQLVINLSGYSFPRDAWQQAALGRNVPFTGSDFEFEAGDLLFFSHPGQRIHHVGISLGGAGYVHASEWVRVQSLSADHPEFTPERFNTLSLVKRIELSELTTLEASVKRLFELS